MAVASAAVEAVPKSAPAEPTQAKLWFHALRAPFLIASLIPATLGVVLAFVQAGTFDPGLAGLTLLGAACFQLATNMLNDNFDYRSGNDLAVDHQNPFAGGGRVLTTGRISPSAHLAVASAFLAVGTAVGIALVFAVGGTSTSAGQLLLVIGVLGWGSTVFYVGPPLRLAHHGLGEIVVGASFGPLVVVGAYLVQARAVSMGSVILSIAMGLLVCAVLWINEFPDVKADLSVGKRTVMARIGPARSIKVYEAMIAGAFGAVGFAAMFRLAPPTILLVLLAAPVAAKTLDAARANYKDPHALIPANAGTILLTVIFGVLLIGGIAVGPILPW